MCAELNMRTVELSDSIKVYLRRHWPSCQVLQPSLNVLKIIWLKLALLHLPLWFFSTFSLFSFLVPASLRLCFSLLLSFSGEQLIAPRPLLYIDWLLTLPAWQEWKQARGEGESRRIQKTHRSCLWSWLQGKKNELALWLHWGLVGISAKQFYALSCTTAEEVVRLVITLLTVSQDVNLFSLLHLQTR